MEFTVMIMFTDVFKDSIERYNKNNNTDFQIVEILRDEIDFCRVRVTKFAESDIFNLGYSLAAMESKLKEQGKISW